MYEHVSLLIIFHILEEVSNLKKVVEGVKEDMNFVCGVVADIKEPVTDTKVSNEDLTEAISKRNGEFYLIGS